MVEHDRRLESEMSSIGSQFRALHEQDGVLILPNPWDVGSAKMLAGMGFSALATTSAGMAFTMGKSESTVSWDKTRAYTQSLVAATPLPVTADLEKGMGDSPESVADTIRAAAAIGLAGCSIEDHTGDPDNPIYDESLAVERIIAAAEACQNLPEDFVLTARCENMCWGQMELDPVISRLQAFERAGADVLYAPGLPDLASIRTVCDALSKPVNVVMGMWGATYTVVELAEVGVRRISIGSAFARLAYGAMIASARQIQQDGRFDLTQDAVTFDEIEALFVAARQR